MIVIIQGTRREHLGSFAFHMQHAIVHRALSRRKLSIDWYRACKVSVVVGIFRTDIKQQHFARLAHLVIFDIVKDAGIGT